MAHITKRPLFSHFRGGPTDHAVHLKHGRTAHEGVGLAFWFRPLSAVFSEVPVDDRELPLVFRGRTADFQDIAVQGSVTYRFADPALAARRLDFGLDPATGAWRATPLDQVATLLTESAQQHALSLLAGMDLARALAEGPAAVRARVSEGLSGDARMSETGIGIVDVRVVAVKPETEVERALRTPARERIQQEADRAGFERRALAVERERAISENELQSRIELAAREELLVAQQGANDRRKATERAAAARITAEAEAANQRLKAETSAEETRVLSAASAQRTRELGAAEAAAEQAKMDVYATADPRTLLALAARQAAEKLPAIGTVNLSPDTLTSALNRLAGE
ncbi:MAG TPA: SPFH domain-containing protein [Actinocrinis sp.]|jgi:regulator of protease activity HflC (stomatin/prohibitin superfamily)